MFNRRYYLQLELNACQHMILAINEEKEGISQIIGYLYLEDFKRAGTPKDFQFLDPIFLEDWDDFRNLIVARVVTFEKVSTDEKDDLLQLANTFIEFKPAVNHKVEFHVAKELPALREKCWEKDIHMGGDYLPIYQWLIDNLSEIPISLEKLTLDSLNHLSQD